MWHPEKNLGIIAYAYYNFFFIISLRQYLSLNSTSRLGYMDNPITFPGSAFPMMWSTKKKKKSPLPVSLYEQKKIIN